MVVYKKILLIHKVAMIMVDKLPNHNWDTKGMKKYTPKFKALQWKDGSLTRLANNNPEPIKKAVKVPSETSQADLQPKETVKRKTKALKGYDVRELNVEIPVGKKIKKHSSVQIKIEEVSLAIESQMKEVVADPNTSVPTDLDQARIQVEEVDLDSSDRAPLSTIFKVTEPVRSPTPKSKTLSPSPKHSHIPYPAQPSSPMNISSSSQPSNKEEYPASSPQHS